MPGGYGYGAGPWGGVPWGDATPPELLEEEYCDLFLFEHCLSMLSVLTSPFVTYAGDPTQFVLNYPDPPPPPTTTCDLGLLSGDLSDPGFATTNAYILAAPYAGIDDQYTLELTVYQEALPNDFSDIVNRHFAFSVTDMTGPCAAIFVSKIGLAYAGAFHHVPAAPTNGDLVLDSSLQVIPGTASVAYVGEYVTYRISVSETTGAVYVYVTKTAELGATGHQLVAVLPTIDASELTFAPVQDRAAISVRGTSTHPTRIGLDEWCLSSQLVIPNIIPVARAGQDQAIRLCSIALLDGTASYDPEGAPLVYSWRLIDAPIGSEFAEEGLDGITYPQAIPTGYTDKFYSLKLAAVEAIDPIEIGDVLVIDGEVRVIGETATDGGGFYVRVTTETIPDNLSGAAFKFLRQRGISGADTATPTFFPDKPGLYKFDLIVFDGVLYSTPSGVILNVLESFLPIGCTPNLDFINNYISDFWPLVEDYEVVEAVWSALAQAAATELYTLWQHEYSKSHRDIQRTIIRRWLHYDLLLAEPLPELTNVRTIWSGIESSNISSTGDPTIKGTSLVLSSPAFEEDQVIDFVAAELPGEVAVELQNRLLEIDSRFSVELIHENAATPTFSIVRIDAPFPVTVAAGTNVPIFAVGDTSGLLEGIGGGSGIRSYVLDRSLQGLDIQEDDLLVVDGVGYRIIRVVDGAYTDPDTYTGQRVALKDELPVPVGTNWKIGSVVTSELLDFYNGMVSDGDPVFFEVNNETAEDTLVQATALGVAAALPGKLAFDATAIGADLETGATIRLAKIVRRTYLPISDLIMDLPVLQPHIVIDDVEAVIRRNLDFFLEEYRGASAIRFVSGNSPDIWEGQVPPDRLWAEYTYVDNSPAIEANFGIPAGLTIDALENLPEVDYLSAVRGLWYAYVNGPTLFNMRVGAQIFLGLPFAEETGVIEEIREDFSPSSGRILVRDTASQEIVRSYRYTRGLELEINPDTGQRYAIGDTVTQFAPLVEGVEIVDYVKEEGWYRDLLDQGIFAEVEKYHSFAVRIDSTVLSIPTLTMVRDFILKVKPVYTYPVFLITFRADDADVDVIDDLSFHGKLHLHDGLCQALGSTMFDDPRSGPRYKGTGSPPYTAPNSAYGSWWNQYDSDDDPDNTPPTPNTSEVVQWGFDKQYLCPDDQLAADIIVPYTGGPSPIKFDDVFAYDETVTYLGQSIDTPGPFVIPAVPGAYIVSGTTPAPLNGNFLATTPLPSKFNVRLIIRGGPGSDPTDYELVVTIAAVDSIVVPFDAGDELVEVWHVATGVAVTAGQAIGFKIRIPSGSASPGARNPAWTYIRAQAVVEDDTWDFDMSMPDGIYIRRERPLD